MGLKASVSERDLFRHPPCKQIHLKCPLVRLGGLIDWVRLSAAMRASCVLKYGRSATSPRPIACLVYLQQTFGVSDEEVIWQSVENPHCQVFTGEAYLQNELPIADALVQAPERSRHGRDVGQDDRGSQAPKRARAIQHQTRDRRHAGDGDSDRASNRFATFGTLSRTTGEAAAQ